MLDQLIPPAYQGLLGIALLGTMATTFLLTRRRKLSPVEILQKVEREVELIPGIEGVTLLFEGSIRLPSGVIIHATLDTDVLEDPSALSNQAAELIALRVTELGLHVRDIRTSTAPRGVLPHGTW